jgi:hypothetical protein
MYLPRNAGLAAALWLSPLAALADCPPIDFEDLAVGTAVTNQYPGVTFSVLPQSCNNAPTLHMRIANALPGGTSSGAQALEIDTGCPDFSPDYLRMRFEDLQRQVSFYVGESTGAAGYDLTSATTAMQPCSERCTSRAAAASIAWCRSARAAARSSSVGWKSIRPSTRSK